MTILLWIGLITGGATIFCLLFDRHTSTIHDYILLILFCTTISMLGYLTELNTPSLAGKITAVKFGYFGKLLINPLLICFVLRYYQSMLHWCWKLLLFLPALIMEFFVFHCDSNSYYYESITLQKNGLLTITPGPIYYATMTYTLSLTALLLALCLYQRRRLHGGSKRLNTILLISTLIPGVCLLLRLLGTTGALDLTPVGLMIGTLMLTAAILKFGLLDKELVLQNMATALILLDNHRHLVYANRAAYQILPSLNEPMFRSHEQDLSPLLTEQFSYVQFGLATYQRRVTNLKAHGYAQGSLITYDDVTEIKARLNRDAMTGLLNHASFYQTLEHAMKYANTLNNPLCVSIADIDSFKRINDNFGHANGDEILISLAHLLKDTCKELDVFRYGGEEFAVIFPCDFDAAEAVMQTALTRFSSMRFKFLDTPVTFSYGTAQFNGTETAVDLFERADQLMYTRKNALHARERAEASQQKTQT